MKTTPKFKTIENFIKEQIAQNKLNIGEQIMTEEQLCKLFNVSRMTVNKALTNLTEAGYINRIPGKGSFVSTPHTSKKIGTKTSFTEDMKAIGLVAGSKLISYQIIRAKEVPDIAKYLQINENDLIHYFVRLRTGNNVPIAISYTYISANIVPAIDVKALDGSFYEFLNSIGIEHSCTNFEIKAAIPNVKQKELLNIKNNDTALLVVRHITYCHKEDNVQVPFEYIITCYNSDLYSYQATS